jgi:acetyltransferase-like isoleucine patch superfamily enzyme
MSRLYRALRELWPWRWLRAGVALLHGVRVHPTAVLQGGADRVRLARGTVIGARTRVILGGTGRLVTGESVWISSDVAIQTDTEVRVGEGTSVQRRCTLNGSTRVGRGCIFAPNVFVSSGTHVFRSIPHLPIQEQERMLRRGGGGAPDRPVWIQDDCWLGVNVVVSPGVTIGKGAVVGANSVVTHDVRPYSVVAGAPAQQIGERLGWHPPREIHVDRETDLIYVLSGIPVQEAGTTRAVAARAAEPVQFAMAVGAARIRIRYHASHGMTVQLGKRVQELMPGDGVIELPGTATRETFGAALVEISLIDPAPGASLSVRDVISTEGV